jgi:adenylosuccinate lyase
MWNMSSFVCPLEFRYGRDEMRRIFEEESRLNKMLLVEASLAKAHASLGRIPKEDADNIAKTASSSNVALERVKEIESETKHDIMALVKALSEASGPSGKYVHLGATSSDILDTASALQFKEALEVIDKGLIELRGEFLNLAQRHRKTIMLGRTHGQAAIPTTFGYKMAVFALEVHRHILRIAQARKRLLVGKMSGAVGTGASFGEDALELQDLVMADLGLEADTASTQIVARDRYAELIFIQVNISGSIEKFATEIRNLLRSDIGEVSEGFDAEKQVGSSTMPHKRNPILAENICGLARIVKGFIHPTLDNIPTWHERDLTNSSAERFIIPHTFILTDDIIAKMGRLLRELGVNEKRMRRNLEDAKGFVMAENVMLVLARKGVGRQEAHELVRKSSMKAHETDQGLKEALLANPEIMKVLSTEEVESAMDPSNYLGSSERIIDRVAEICKG